MSYFRINIYLSIIDFIKCFFLSTPNNKLIKKLINRNSKKKYFIITSQLRVSFLLLLKYLKKKYPKKNEIIFQPFNLPEMLNISKNIGFKIKFIEQNKLTGQQKIEKLISIVNKKTLAIVVTNIFSSPSALIKLKNFCKKKKIILIEDNAIYFDNFYIKNKKRVYSGSLGDFSLYSFNIMKNISGFFGGGISTNDKYFSKYAENEILKYEDFYKSKLIMQIIIYFILKILKFKILYKLFLKLLKYAHEQKNNFILKIVYPSLKFKKKEFPKYYFTKISNLSKKAVFLQLSNQERRNQNHFIRKKNNICYYNSFNQFKINGVKLLKIEDFNFQNFIDFPILVENKEKLNRYLLAHGVETKQIYYHDCAKIFNSDLKKSINKNSKYFSDKVIGLPNHKGISKEYIKLVVYRIKTFYD